MKNDFSINKWGIQGIILSILLAQLLSGIIYVYDEYKLNNPVESTFGYHRYLISKVEHAKFYDKEFKKEVQTNYKYFIVDESTWKQNNEKIYFGYGGSNKLGGYKKDFKIVYNFKDINTNQINYYPNKKTNLFISNRGEYSLITYVQMYNNIEKNYIYKKNDDGTVSNYTSVNKHYVQPIFIDITLYYFLIHMTLFLFIITTKKKKKQKYSKPIYVAKKIIILIALFISTFFILQWINDGYKYYKMNTPPLIYNASNIYDSYYMIKIKNDVKVYSDKELTKISKTSDKIFIVKKNKKNDNISLIKRNHYISNDAKFDYIYDLSEVDENIISNIINNSRTHTKIRKIYEKNGLIYIEVSPFYTYSYIVIYGKDIKDNNPENYEYIKSYSMKDQIINLIVAAMVSFLYLILPILIKLLSFINRLLRHIIRMIF